MFCVSVFQGSLLVTVIMIDGSEKRNCKGSVRENRSKLNIRKGRNAG